MASLVDNTLEAVLALPRTGFVAARLVAEVVVSYPSIVGARAFVAVVDFAASVDTETDPYLVAFPGVVVVVVVDVVVGSQTYSGCPDKAAYHLEGKLHALAADSLVHRMAEMTPKSP